MMADINELWEVKRNKLEKQLIKTALDLFEHTGSNSFLIPVKNTTPKLFIAAGENANMGGVGSNPIPGHKFYDRDDGLAHCKICNGAEGSLPTDCPGRKMEEHVERLVSHGCLDFKSGGWVLNIKPRN